MLLEHLLVLGRLIHLEVREEFATLRDFAEEAFAGGLVLLVILQMTREEADLLGQDGDLHLRAAGIFGVLAVLGNQVLFRGALEGHKR